MKGKKRIKSLLSCGQVKGARNGEAIEARNSKIGKDLLPLGPKGIKKARKPVTQSQGKLELWRRGACWQELPPWGSWHLPEQQC